MRVVMGKVNPVWHGLFSPSVLVDRLLQAEKDAGWKAHDTQSVGLNRFDQRVAVKVEHD